MPFRPPQPSHVPDDSPGASMPPKTTAIWRHARILGPSSLRDTLHSGHHSRDFSLARNEYLRSRVLVTGALFILLAPLWLLIDSWLLPQAALAHVVPGRLFLLAGLAATLLLACRSRGHRWQARVATGLLIGLPAAFYGLTLLSVPPGQMHQLVGYSFIPYLLMALLAIFPLTLIESLLAAAALFLIECLAQQHAGIWLTPEGWEGLWLLSALMAISLTANYFHLGLLMRLYRQATHDPLTGLLNRRALHQFVVQSRRLHPHAEGGLMLIDIDHFKQVNDTHGHAFGDRVLRHLATLLQGAIPADAVAARYGGEEFLVVLPQVDPQTLAARAEAIRRQVAALRLEDYDGEAAPLSVSLGVTRYSADEDFDLAVKRADERLYRAKAGGRNQVVSS